MLALKSDSIPFAIYGMCDSSPQGGRDWLLSTMQTVGSTTADMAQCGAWAHELVMQVLRGKAALGDPDQSMVDEMAEVAAKLSRHSRVRILPPAALGVRRSDLLHKVSAFTIYVHNLFMKKITRIRRTKIKNGAHALQSVHVRAAGSRRSAVSAGMGTYARPPMQGMARAPPASPFPFIADFGPGGIRLVLAATAAPPFPQRCPGLWLCPPGSVALPPPPGRRGAFPAAKPPLPPPRSAAGLG